MKKLLLMGFLVGLLASCGGVELTPLEKKEELVTKVIFEKDKKAEEELDKILQDLKEKSDSGKAREELKEWKEVIAKIRLKKSLELPFEKPVF